MTTKPNNKPLLGTDIWSLQSKMNGYNTELAELIKEVNQEIAEVQELLKSIPPSSGAIFLYILNWASFLKSDEEKLIELREKVSNLLLETMAENKPRN